MNNISLNEWMDALVLSAQDFAEQALGLDESKSSPVIRALPEVSTYAIVALIGDKEQLQVGIVGSPDACMALVRKFLGMEPGDEELSSQDMVDALGEVANVMAGILKSRMASAGIPMNIGLPMVVNGNASFPTDIETASVTVTWETIEIQLLLLLHRNGG